MVLLIIKGIESIQNLFSISLTFIPNACTLHLQTFIRSKSRLYAQGSAYLMVNNRQSTLML